jgi:hypothetical protein
MFFLQSDDEKAMLQSTANARRLTIAVGRSPAGVREVTDVAATVCLVVYSGIVRSTGVHSADVIFCRVARMHT